MVLWESWSAWYQLLCWITMACCSAQAGRKTGSNGGDQPERCPACIEPHIRRHVVLLPFPGRRCLDRDQRAVRLSTSISSAILRLCSAASPLRMACSTQWVMWSRRTSSSTRLSAARTAAICVTPRWSRTSFWMLRGSVSRALRQRSGTHGLSCGAEANAPTPSTGSATCQRRRRGSSALRRAATHRRGARPSCRDRRRS